MLMPRECHCAAGWLLAVLFAGDVPAADLKLDAVLDAWDSSCADIHSYEVLVTTNHITRNDETGEMEPVVEYVCRHRFRNQMWRVDRLREERFAKKTVQETSENKVWAITWDGKDIRMCNGPADLGGIVARPRFNESLIGGPLFHELYFSSYFGEPYVRNIRTRPVADLTRNGTRYVIKAPPAPESNVTWRSYRLEVELEELYNFMPVRISLFDHADSREPCVEISNTYREWRPGLWAPERAVKTTYLPKETGGSEVFAEVIVEVSPDDWKFNSEIDPALFTLTFPKGTIVYDDYEKRN